MILFLGTALCTLVLVLGNRRPAGADKSAGRFAAERSAKVTKYQQQWSVLPLDSFGGGNSNERIVHAKMSVDYLVTSGTYSSNYKSLVDKSHIKSISNVRVVEMVGTTAVARRHDMWERDEYILVTWYYDAPASVGDVVSVVVEYDIYGAVSGCSLPAVERSEDDGDGDVASPDVTNTCRETFEAPWANYWSIPVDDIEYIRLKYPRMIIISYMHRIRCY